MWEGNADTYIWFPCSFPDSSKLQYAFHPALMTEICVCVCVCYMSLYVLYIVLKQKVL